MIIWFKDGEIDLEELVDDFLTFFAAGQETTSNALSFTVLELGLNPHCFKKWLKHKSHRLLLIIG